MYTMLLPIVVHIDFYLCVDVSHHIQNLYIRKRVRVLGGGVGGAKSNETTERKIQHSLGREVAIIAVLVGGRERGAGS